jgi:hypothetical protein
MSAPHAPTTPTVAAVTSFLEKFYKELGKMFFWLTVVIMALVVLRVMQYPAAIPMGLAAVAVLASYSVVWGSSATGRRIAMYAATFILLLTIAAFLLPLNYIKTIPSRDEIGEKLVEKGLLGGAWDGLKTLAFGKSAEETATTYDPTPSRDEIEDPIRGVTPMKIRANYPFVLESDQPIKVTYEDGQSFIHLPGECIVAPTPRSLGPKSFTDPDNKEGHLAFRLYRFQSNGACP